MDENNLTILLQQGDRNAYKQLFIKYYSPLCEYASQYISDDDSEELVQELMLFLWETRENLVIETSLKTYRETFAMSRFGEKTNVQIAEKLGISVKTVEYRISQALKILRFKLKDYLPLLINILG